MVSRVASAPLRTLIKTSSPCEYRPMISGFESSSIIADAITTKILKDVKSNSGVALDLENDENLSAAHAVAGLVVHHFLCRIRNNFLVQE